MWGRDPTFLSLCYNEIQSVFQALFRCKLHKYPKGLYERMSNNNTPPSGGIAKEIFMTTANLRFKIWVKITLWLGIFTMFPWFAMKEDRLNDEIVAVVIAREKKLVPIDFWIKRTPQDLPAQ